MSPYSAIALVVLLGFRALGCLSSKASSLRGEGESQARVQQVAFLDELALLFGASHRAGTESLLDSLAETIRPTFASLPKNRRGAVSVSAARYAVHRVFVQRHGWYIKGLEPGSGSWTTSELALGMGDRLPQRLRMLIEDRLSSNDFYLDEIATLVATLETLIHGEVLGRLRESYRVLGRDAESTLEEQEALELLDFYMATYLAGYNVSSFPKSSLDRHVEYVTERFDYWHHYKGLTREALHELSPGKTAYGFSDLLAVLEHVSERVGRAHDTGTCSQIQRELTLHEDTGGSGRVRLIDFYQAFLNGTTLFDDRVEFLRQNGALDETDPATPRVVIPNYLGMRSRCLNVTNLYDICCIDKCAALFGQLESKLQAPFATPGEVISAVSTLQSAYAPSSLELPAALVSKLHEVADSHNGMVPMHGRLFAQWMHHAYPEECSYPHVSGTIVRLMPQEWRKQTGTVSYLKKGEMRHYVEAMLEEQNFQAPCSGDSEDGTCSSAMWLHEEELVDEVNGKVQAQQRRWPRLRVALRLGSGLLVLLGALAALPGSVWQGLELLAGGGLQAWSAKLSKMGLIRNEKLII